VMMASIGAVTSETLRSFCFEPAVAAKESTIHGLIEGILEKCERV
jgi:uroporphyrinogen-III synthase